ncbi:MAG TPA: SufS family cysteine desulfurase [Actinomycetota bacterium]|nr:SufS family cysteine desulfurase [Actinomycetota bacterium]
MPTTDGPIPLAPPDGLPSAELIGQLANRAYRALPEGEPGDTAKRAFNELADRCPGPFLLRQLMQASASGNGQAAAPVSAAPTPALLEGLPHLESPAYSFLAGSPLGAAPAPPLLPGVRPDFPALHQRVNGSPLVWLDNAATTHKPQAVIDAVSHFYARDNSNVHRGAHALAVRATEAYEGAREKVASFLGAASAEEIVWVRGATEGINLVAQAYGRRFVAPGDEVIVSTLEHHSNIVPWQMLCEATGSTLKVIPITDDGELLLDAYAALLGARTRIVAITAVSNVLGTVVPLRPVVEMAHAAGARVVVDGAQEVQHLPVDVAALDADFYVFSGHKIFGPTGIGALYGKRELLEQAPPWQGGGSMIDRVTFEKTTYATVPAKFEAGTGHLAGAIGLAAAIDYVRGVGLEAIAAHEQRLVAHGTEALASVPGLRLLGGGLHRTSMLTFVIPGVPAERIGAFLDREGIAVRAGHHCAQPLLQRLGLTAAVRASVALYNTLEEIDALASALHRGVRRSWE